jgi:class 3 adenylate cyclase
MNQEKSGHRCYVISIEEEGQVLESRALAERAKEECDALASAIIPPCLRDSVEHMDFSCPYASIISMELVNFGALSTCESPSRILEVLTSFCAAMERKAQRMSSITKICSNGDRFFWASGLFSKERIECVHDAVEFAFLAHDVVEDLTLKTNLELQIRTGIETGGPVIVGFFPAFNHGELFGVVGNVVDKAKGLMQKGEIGSISASEETVRHVNCAEVLVCRSGGIAEYTLKRM